MTYSEKLKSPKWQKKRLEVLNHANFRCQICGVSDKQLHVHHSYYLKSKEPWQYPLGALISVCKRCHDLIHGRKVPQSYDVEVSHEPVQNFIGPRKSKFSELKKLLEGAS